MSAKIRIMVCHGENLSPETIQALGEAVVKFLADVPEEQGEQVQQRVKRVRRKAIAEAEGKTGGQ